VIALGDDRAEQVGLRVRRAQCRAVSRAEALGQRILGEARRTDFLVAHRLSTRSVWSPISTRCPAFTAFSPRTATAMPLRLPSSSTMNSRASLPLPPGLPP